MERGAGSVEVCEQALDDTPTELWQNRQSGLKDARPVMGAEQAALTMPIVMEGGMKRKGLPVDVELIEKTRANIIENFEK